MKKILLGLLVLYIAILACGLWQSAHSTSFYGTPILASATFMFSDINQFILLKLFGYRSSYFEVFLYQDRHNYWTLMAALSLLEVTVILFAGYVVMRSLLNLRLRLRR